MLARFFNPTARSTGSKLSTFTRPAKPVSKNYPRLKSKRVNNDQDCTEVSLKFLLLGIGSAASASTFNTISDLADYNDSEYRDFWMNLSIGTTLGSSIVNGIGIAYSSNVWNPLFVIIHGFLFVYSSCKVLILN